MNDHLVQVKKANFGAQGHVVKETICILRAAPKIAIKADRANGIIRVDHTRTKPSLNCQEACIVIAPVVCSFMSS